MDDNDLCSFCSGLVLSQIDGLDNVVMMSEETFMLMVVF